MIYIDLDKDSLTFNCQTCRAELTIIPSDYMDEFTETIKYDGECVFCEGTWWDAVKEIYTRDEESKKTAIGECIAYSWNRMVERLKVSYY